MQVVIHCFGYLQVVGSVCYTIGYKISGLCSLSVTNIVAIYGESFSGYVIGKAPVAHKSGGNSKLVWFIGDAN
jgi:hypothetical protein